jgi:hypothetical protein
MASLRRTWGGREGNGWAVSGGWGGERARTPRSRARGGRGRGAARPGHTAREGEEREEGPRWGQPGSEGGAGKGGRGG